MQSTLRLCVAQMTSTNQHAGNIDFLRDAARYASTNRCHCLALPEVAGLMNKDQDALRRYVVDKNTDPYINACREFAEAYQLWVQTGSTPVTGHDGRFLNHGNLIDDRGRVRAGYDKIHLFDVCLECLPAIGESQRYMPGTQAVAVNTPWGAWGMSICYDLRFPQLYRDYAKAGATILFIPSAFTVSTGEAHWEVLLRARAIETGCFVVASAQVGTHDDGRETWGHSMVVDPWGKVLLDMGGTEAGVEIIDLDLSLVERARKQIPSLTNERSYEFIIETAQGNKWLSENE